MVKFLEIIDNCYLKLFHTITKLYKDFKFCDNFDLSDTKTSLLAVKSKTDSQDGTLALDAASIQTCKESLVRVLDKFEIYTFKSVMFAFLNFENISRNKDLTSFFLYLIWQKLHTGHWCNIPIELREIFTCASMILTGFLLQECKNQMKNVEFSSNEIKSVSLKIIQVCDRGLLMGKPIANNLLAEIAAMLNNRALSDKVPLFQVASQSLQSDILEIYSFENTKLIEESKLPSLNSFLLNYMQQELPLKLFGIAETWPALKKWNFEFFYLEVGARVVPVEIGNRYTDKNWSQMLMTIGDYLSKFCSKTNSSIKAYLAQHQLFNQVPELFDDISIPDYCHMGEKEPAVNVWIGPANTVTPLHFDPDHNIFVQIYGYKLVLLFPPSDTKSLYAFSGKLLNNTSEINLDEISKQKDPFQKYPLLKGTIPYYTVLRPGESLYIPPKWWHYVRSFSNSISVSFWWR